MPVVRTKYPGEEYDYSAYSEYVPKRKPYIANNLQSNSSDRSDGIHMSIPRDDTLPPFNVRYKNAINWEIVNTVGAFSSLSIYKC